MAFGAYCSFDCYKYLFFSERVERNLLSHKVALPSYRLQHTCEDLCSSKLDCPTLFLTSRWVLPEALLERTLAELYISAVLCTSIPNGSLDGGRFVRRIA